jgi:hypothetical protein
MSENSGKFSSFPNQTDDNFFSDSDPERDPDRDRKRRKLEHDSTSSTGQQENDSASAYSQADMLILSRSASLHGPCEMRSDSETSIADGLLSDSDIELDGPEVETVTTGIDTNMTTSTGPRSLKLEDLIMEHDTITFVPSHRPHGIDHKFILNVDGTFEMIDGTDDYAGSSTCGHWTGRWVIVGDSLMLIYIKDYSYGKPIDCYYRFELKCGPITFRTEPMLQMIYIGFGKSPCPPSNRELSIFHVAYSLQNYYPQIFESVLFKTSDMENDLME